MPSLSALLTLSFARWSLPFVELDAFSPMILDFLKYLIFLDPSFPSNWDSLLAWGPGLQGVECVVNGTVPVYNDKEKWMGCAGVCVWGFISSLLPRHPTPAPAHTQVTLWFTSWPQRNIPGYTCCDAPAIHGQSRMGPLLLLVHRFWATSTFCFCPLLCEALALGFHLQSDPICFLIFYNDFWFTRCSLYCFLVRIWISSDILWAVYRELKKKQLHVLSLLSWRRSWKALYTDYCNTDHLVI